MRSGTSLLVGLALLASCSVPPPEPLEADKVAATVTSRAEPSPELLEAALALHNAPPLGLVVPEQIDTHDAASDWFWHAHAIAYERRVRATRRAWRAAQARTGVVGQPGPIRVTYSPEDIGPGASQHELAATVDLLSLLGLGVRPADRQVARQFAAVALGQLEEAVWEAAFAVDRSRVQLAAASRREAALAMLLEEARRDLRRLQLLHKLERLGDGPFGRAEAVVAEVETRLSQRSAATVVARAGLARASGLPPEAPALDAIGAAHEPRLETQAATPPTPRQLLDELPGLRAAGLSHALAEARLRAAISEWWPTLRIGPRLKFQPGDDLYGGIVSLDLPWPGPVSRDIEAAGEERAAAREAVEDALAAALVTAHAKARELELAREHLARDVVPQEQGSAAAWRSARAHIWVHEGPDILETWVDALRLRVRGVLARLDAVERVRLADLSYRESAGIPPGLGAPPR